MTLATPRMFTKLLIANRGEIACRVIRTARALGCRTVAVYSDADAGAPHVRAADEALRIGAAPAADSYLNIEALIAAARATGSDAIHPGYGFLSERAEFAEACEAAGIIFVGPPPEAIRAMGDKAAAKRRMLAAGVPCAAGYLGEDQSDEGLLTEATKLGLPLLVKATAGGGGRGMRLVREATELPAAIAAARREAVSAFGDGALMLERLIEGGRHIEVQVFADHHGHTIHLGERDCTAQRRRQKVIEEAPSPVVDAAMREAMGRDAVAAARAVGYVGAGTVEFIVDAEGRHCFLEMNTRLQVEHPVTECITGLDLVEWQLRVAAGEPLPLAQQDLRFDGHAIEVRLYAEDPYDGFAPQTGRVLHWQPAAASGIRIDSGIAEAVEVTPHYDAMVAKLIAHGRDRGDAIARLRVALADNPLVGLRHNARFLADLLGSEAFGGTAMHTGTLDGWAAAGNALLRRPAPSEALWSLAAALTGGDASGQPASVRAQTLVLLCDGQRRSLALPQPGVTIEGWQGRRVRWHCNGVSRETLALWQAGTAGGTLHLAEDAAVFCFCEASPWPADAAATDPGRARAPVAGVVAQVVVQPGQAVAAGAPLASVEAMKMEMWLTAAAAGTVRAVHVKPKDSVAAGALLVELELDPA